MNWRKPLITCLLKGSSSNILDNLDYIKNLEYKNPQEIKTIQATKLKKVLLHAWKNVPYYNKVLQQAKVIDNTGEVVLDNFEKIPALTKEIIKNNFESLKSQDKDYHKRKPYLNTSGGSTGEPVKFIQDKIYQDWNIANKIYYKTFVGQEIGDKEIRLWGSERDVLKGKERISDKLHNWIYNRLDLNAFKMRPQDLHFYVDKINKGKPSWIEGYVQPIYELCKFIKENDLEIYQPKGLLTSAGTLYPIMKNLIEEVFQCKTFNRYGTREVGDAACNCECQEGLHLSPWNHYFEILNKKFTPVKPGEGGRIHITTLNNFSMPLIRYDIGDIGIASEKEICSCGRGAPLIKKIEGREMTVFKTKSGKIVPAEFFIHFIGVVFNKGFISRFQVIQIDYNLIKIKIIVKNKEEFSVYKPQIEASIKNVMEDECEIEWEFVDKIPPMRSGKYLYTISEIEENFKHE